MSKKFNPNDTVKSCYKLESGLRLGQEGIHACQLGPFSSPIFFTENEASQRKITKNDIISKREWIFDLLNDETATTPCKGCSMVVKKPFKDVRFDLLGHVDLAATTTCNLRCNFCGYTHHDSFRDASYDTLSILEEFGSDDITWNSAVDFNGGEPTLLKDFDDYIKYFEEHRSRVFLFTNGLIYKQSVYDGLVNGTIRWAIVSLDAGTTSTYDKTKLSPKFDKVLENIARYSEAGSKGGGNCSVKYIFHKDNLGDDDITGFCYSMLALRPQEVWLTFDFDPLNGLPADSPDLGGLDYSDHVSAYAKTYNMLEKHGLKAVHYAEKHLAPASKHGEILLRMAKDEIAKTRKNVISTLHLSDFRQTKLEKNSQSDGGFSLKNGAVEIYTDNDWCKDTLVGKTVAVAPASPKIKEFVSALKKSGAEVIAILDKDIVLQGKYINGVEIMAYEKLSRLKPEITFVATANTVIEPAIIQKTREQTTSCKILSFYHSQSVQNDLPTELVSLDPNVDEPTSMKETKDIEGVAEMEELLRWSRHTPI